MKLITCSAVLSFVTKLEEETAKFYENLAEKYSEGRETFLSFSKDNRKNKTVVERAYYGVISDALEACFSFGLNTGGLDSDAYGVRTEISKDASYKDALKTMIKIEETVQKAYTDAAALSEGLMADVPRAFKIMAKKRGERVARLRALV